MNRRQFIKSAASLSTTFFVSNRIGQLPTCHASTTTNQKPNIILLLNDDHGWGDLSCQGHPVIRTPALDQLALEGCRFTDYTTCFPVCSPSRAAILTGRDPNRFGMRHIINDGSDPIIPTFHHVPLEEPSLAHQLKLAGYRTSHIGKWHLSFVGHENEPTPGDYGFDEWMVLGAGRHTSYYNSTWNRMGERTKTEGRWSAEVYVTEAIDFIKRNKGNPFFVNLWSFAPHAEVECADSFKDRYASYTQQEQTYYGTITQQDEEYGRLLKFLDEEGLSDNTIVVFSSDNGCDAPTLSWLVNSRGSSGPFRGSKHNIYEGGIRVPAIIRWPGKTQPGTVSPIPVSELDLFPTLCHAAGAPMPEGLPFDGTDLQPAFGKQPLERPHLLYWQYEPSYLLIEEGVEFTSPPLAVRKGSWKLLSNHNFDRLELYNLDNDPGEKWNMATIHADIAHNLLVDLKKIHSDINSEYALKARFLNPGISNPQIEPHLRLKGSTLID